MSNLVKIKILKNVGHYKEGQEIEVPSELAATLCAPRERHDGEKVIRFQVAATLADLEKLRDLAVEQGGYSLDELRALGLQRPAVDPNGPGHILPKGILEFEKQEKAKKEAAEKATSDEASFDEVKSTDEGKSALQSLELNQKNPASKKKA